jgi:hypothetical protein
LIYWLPSEYVEKRTYRSLKRAWIGFKIAKQQGNHDKMKYYAEGIQKFQRQLRLPVSNFSDILKEETRNSLDSQVKPNEGGGVAVNELSLGSS